jgi:hypothetical protein
VQKKDGTKRFCVDYRKLNSATKKDVYPIPRLEDVLERLDEMKYFTTLDLVQSYYQIAVAEADKEKTAFITEQGSYEYNVMPFGLTNAPATFQRLMNLVLAGLNWKMCLVYIDDILIFSRTFEEHMVHIRAVFDRLRSANLKLKLTKCSFAEDSTTYLGHKISSAGVSPDPEKVTAVRKLDIKLWQNVTDVKAFLGMVGYYRRFIRGFADITRPLTALLRKDAPFVIDKEVRRAFKRLKSALIEAPILAYPRLEVPFVLQVDASNYGMGAVLTQYYNDEEHPIAYFSRKFTGSEQKYAIMERECLAMVEGIKHFRAYLFGQKFVVMTDHKPLEHIDSFKNHNGRVARWRMTLSDYDFEVIARPGSQNANADALSRLPVNVINVVTPMQTFADTTDPKTLAELQKKDRTLRDIILYLKKNKLPPSKKRANRIIRESELCCMVDGVLYHGYLPSKKRRMNATLRLVVPDPYRIEILQYFHNDPLGAHQGIQKTFDLISSRFYWPKMFQSVSDHVRSCVKCIAKKTPRSKKAGMMQSIIPKHPFDIVGVDILGPLPMTSRKNRYILVFTDYFTKFPICYRLKDINATTVAKKLLKVMLEHGPMNRLVSDRGSQFMSKVFTAIADAAGIKHAPSTSYHPQTNGLTERFNHTLCVMLSMYVHDNQKDWDLFLPFVQHAYRDTPHTSTGYAPFELLRTYRPKSLIEFKFPSISWEVLKTSPGGIDAITERIRTIHADVAKRLKVARETQTEYYNQDRRKVSYKVGDRVWFYWPARGVDAPKLKLSLPWSGPYWVKEVVGPVNYRLTKPDGTTLKQTVHVDRLKLCTSTLGSPTEFVSLHENDSFDPEVEKGFKNYDEIPVIREETMQAEFDVPTTLENFIEIPSDRLKKLSGVENKDESVDTRSRELIDKTTDVIALKEMLKIYELKKLSEATKQYNSQIKRLKRRIHEIEHPLNYQEGGEKLNSTEKEVEPQFHSNTTPAQPLREMNYDENAEFFENFTEPEFKKELYNALVDVYVQYRDKHPSTSIARVKKDLNVIFSSPNVTNGTRIKNFRNQLAALEDNSDLIEFLRACLLNFTDIFDEEISSERLRMKKSLLGSKQVKEGRNVMK